MPVTPCCPWRSVWLARAVAVTVLVVGVPLFLRMPPWCDITLYQMAARNILKGGAHYQGVFDTNLPGFVWALTALQSVFGPSVVAVRAADLLVVLGVVLLTDRLAKWGGATPAARWWAFAGAAVFYPFTVEMSHAQRDTWMALPALAAVVLRVRRASGEPLAASRVARKSLLEGVLWGAAVWVKPHVVVLAAAVWLLTARRLAGEHPRPWRAALFDFLGNLAGGLAIGAAGVALLFATGAWGPLVDVFTNWNPGYLDLVLFELDDREKQELYWFPPWSLGLIVTVPLALVSLVDMAPWASRAAATARQHGPVGRWLPRHLWDKQVGADARFARGVLGGLYLAWVAQAFYLQRGFEYAHAPEVLLMLGVWASHRWAWAVVMLLWVAVAAGAWNVEGTRAELEALPKPIRDHYAPRHPLFNLERLKLWPTCWRPDLTPAERYALWDKLRLHPPHEAVISWEELAEVAAFLKAQNAGDGEVIAWFDSPHAVYLMLNVDPGIRFMHVNTAASIGQWRTDGETGRDKVMRELKHDTPRARFVVNDLEWVTLSAQTDEQRAAWTGPARNPPHDLMPAATPYPNEFPFNQPTLFRTRNGTGRYIVHKVVTRENDPNE